MRVCVLEQIPSHKNTLCKEINPGILAVISAAYQPACGEGHGDCARSFQVRCLVESRLVAKAEVNIHFSFIGF